MSRVSIVRCYSYERSEVEERVRQAVAMVGGFAVYMQPGEKVLLKPNMIGPLPPGQGVTTHPEVVRAVIRGCQEAGAEVWVGDSPAFGSTAMVAAVCGIRAVCEETGARLVSFDVIREVPFAEGRVAKRFLLAEAVVAADKVISLAKMKTHALTLYTGAVKNLYGTIVGMEKSRLHFTYQTPTEFARLLVDLYGAVRPVLSLVDGVVAMEGEGPRGGPLRRGNLLLAGDDAMAVDAVAATTMGLAPKMVPFLAEAAAQGLVSLDLSGIEMAGLTLEEARIPGFVLLPAPRKTNFPRWLDDFARKHLTARPVIIPELCQACNICAKNCPAQAVHMERGHAVIDSSQCIRCYCCQEVCPQGAVKLRRSLIGSLLRWR